MTPDWDHLRVFLAVARAGQFLAAGRALGVDHATVARRMSALESQLGARLVSRSTIGVSLTPAGEALVETAEAMETLWLNAHGSISATARTVVGTVRIGAPDGFGTLFLAPRLPRLLDRHPGLNLQLVPLQRLFSLSRREADLAVVIDPPDEARLTVRKLTDYGLGFYATPAYLAAHGAPATLEALKRHRLVTSVPDLHYTEALRYFPAGFDADQPRLECVSVVAQVAAVRAGAGIGILHDYAARDTADGFVRLLPAIGFRRSYHLVAPQDLRRLARIDEVYRFIVDTVAAAADVFG